MMKRKENGTFHRNETIKYENDIIFLEKRFFGAMFNNFFEKKNALLIQRSWCKIFNFKRRSGEN